MTEDAYLPVSLRREILTEICRKEPKACTVAGAHGLHGVAASVKRLRQNGYPGASVLRRGGVCKAGHYIDDLRYAKQYIRHHQQKKSSQCSKMDPGEKGDRRQIGGGELAGGVCVG